MAKLYSQKNKTSKKLIPTKETVSFILSYSKALHIVTVGKITFDNVLN
jgi:hypothetical protein